VSLILERKGGERKGPPDSGKSCPPRAYEEKSPSMRGGRRREKRRSSIAAGEESKGGPLLPIPPEKREKTEMKLSIPERGKVLAISRQRQGGKRALDPFNHARAARRLGGKGKGEKCSPFLPLGQMLHHRDLERKEPLLSRQKNAGSFPMPRKDSTFRFWKREREREGNLYNRT